jgi:hypothetical protein
MSMVLSYILTNISSISFVFTLLLSLLSFFGAQIYDMIFENIVFKVKIMTFYC